jgi:hypothetical protein
VRQWILRRLFCWHMKRIDHYKREIQAGRLTMAQATRRFTRECRVVDWLAGMGARTLPS